MQRVEHNGQMHEFPTEATPEQIAKALNVQYSPSAAGGAQQQQQPMEIPAGVRLGMSLMRPMTESVPERFRAAKRGAQDIGQGLKQAYLTGAEKLGYKPHGSAEDYTKEVQKDRAAYEKNPESQDFLNQIIRGGTANAPSIALGGLGWGVGKNLLMQMLGAGAGTALGASTEFIDEPEKRFEHMLKAGTVGTAVPAIPKAAGIAGSMLKKINPMQLSSKNIASDILASKAAKEASYSDKYNKIFSDARAQGFSDVKINNKKINLKEITESFPKKYTKKLRELMKNDTQSLEKQTKKEIKRIRKFLPGHYTDDKVKEFLPKKDIKPLKKDVQLAHESQSDLKKYVRILEKREANLGLSNPEQNAKEQAKKAIKQINKSMFNGSKEFKKDYEKINTGYKTDVVPYKHKSIKDYRDREIDAKRLIAALSKKPKLVEKHKKLAIRNNAVPAAVGALGVGGLFKANSILDDLMGKKD